MKTNTKLKEPANGDNVEVVLKNGMRFNGIYMNGVYFLGSFQVKQENISECKVMKNG